MAKFTSIWGDLTVGSVTPVEPKDPEVPPADPVDPVPGADPVVDPDKVVGGNEPTAVITKVGDADPVPDPAPADPTPDPDPTPAAREFEEEEIERTYNLLIDEGVLPEPLEGEEGFDVTPEGLADAIAAVTRKRVAEEISAIPDSVQQFYAHVMDGKEPGDFKVSAPIIWDDINLEEEANQELALTQFYVNQGMSVEEARDEVEDVKEAGKLDHKSDVARDALVKVQSAAVLAKEKKAADDKALQQSKVDDEVDELKKTIDNSKSIAGFTLDDKKKKQFKDYLFKVKPRTGKTQMQENMSSEDRRMNIAFLDFVDYTKADLTKEVQTDMTKKRKKRLTRYSDTGIRGSNSSKSVTTKTDGNKGRVVFPSIFGTQSVDVED